MLIGLDYAGYLPKIIHVQDHLLIYKNPDGTCVRGSHPRLMEYTEILIKYVLVNFCQRIDNSQFLSTEALGVVYNPPVEIVDVVHVLSEEIHTQYVKNVS